VTSGGDGGAVGRLAALGLELPAVPAPAGAYVPAVRVGTLVFTSGQLPLVDGHLAATGAVGREVTPEQARTLAATAALNALAAVAAEAGGLERIARVVKMVGFVASDPGFTGQPGVVDGASELLAAVLGDAGRHARSAVGVAALPKGAPVEVELVVELAAQSAGAADGDDIAGNDPAGNDPAS
jgi:enamine deaminase RidA (YjgF/YER057c/UK114 family)